MLALAQRALLARLAALRERHPWAPLVIGFIAYAWVAGRQLAEIGTPWVGHDFYDLYYAATANRIEGASIYDVEAALRYAGRELSISGLPNGMRTPLGVMLVMPLTKIDVHHARSLFWMLGHAALGMTVWAVCRIARAAMGQHVSEVFAGTFAMTAVFAAPVIDHGWQAQSHLITLALAMWALAFHFERPGRPRSGILLGVAIAVGLFPAIVLPFMLVRRRWATTALAVATAIAATFATTALFPISDVFALVSRLQASAFAPAMEDSAGNMSMTATAIAFAARIDGPAALGPILGMVLRYGLPWVALAHHGWSRAADNQAAAALRLCQAFVLLACVVQHWWIQDLVVLLPIVLLCAIVLADRRATGDRGALPWVFMTSLVTLALVHHPLTYGALDGALGPDSRDTHATIVSALWDVERCALVGLWVVAELLIRRGELLPQNRATPYA